MQHDPFLPEIERFLTETGIGASTFGRKTLKDPSFVRECRLMGRKIGDDTRKTLEAFMKAERRKRGKRAA
jgi:hypothetical protein